MLCLFCLRKGQEEEEECLPCSCPLEIINCENQNMRELPDLGASKVDSIQRMFVKGNALNLYNILKILSSYRSK